MQRVKPPPSWTFKGSCWEPRCRRPPPPPRPEQASDTHPQDRSWLPPAPPHDGGLQPLYKPLSAAGGRREFSLCPLPSRLTRTPGCHSRRGLFPAPQPPACLGVPSAVTSVSPHPPGKGCPLFPLKPGRSGSAILLLHPGRAAGDPRAGALARSRTVLGRGGGCLVRRDSGLEAALPPPLHPFATGNTKQGEHLLLKPSLTSPPPPQAEGWVKSGVVPRPGSAHTPKPRGRGRGRR